MSNRRIVVTGVGAVTPIGIGKDEFWAGILAGRSGVAEITQFDHGGFPVHIAGEVKGFDSSSHFPRREARHLDRFVQFAIVSASEAVADSGIDFTTMEKDRAGCLWASGIGGLAEMERTHKVLLERGPSKVNPYFIPKLMVNAAAGQIAIRFGLQGVNFAVSSACASAGHALGVGLQTIRSGVADVLIVGGSEATVTPLGVSGFCALRALSTRNDDPERASRPFCKDRDGFVIGEGAGALVLEEYETARRRGARIYCELGGVGMTDDAYHISAPVPDGALASRAMQLACSSASVAPEAVDYINAHGTSTQLNDAMETRAIHKTFGEHSRRLLVSSTKSQIGHLLGAAGAVAAVTTVLALERQVAPATINYFTPDPECDLDYVPNEPREIPLQCAMSNSFGFGGHNVSVLFSRM